MVKKRPIPRLKDCIDTKGMFDGKKSDSYLRELRDTIQLTETVYTSITNRIDNFAKDLLGLDGLAGTITERYEAKAKGLQSESNRKGLLQAIIVHKLDKEDIRTLCRLIDYAFEYILWRINEERILPHRIVTMQQLHKERNTNRHLYHLYDNLATELNITVSGKNNSDIYQLWCFKNEFSHALDDETWMEKTLGTIDWVKGKATSVTKPKLSDNIERVAEMIKEYVQDKQLAKALLACLRIASHTSI